LEHETIWKDRKQVHRHLAGKERCEPLSCMERTQTSRWVAHSGKGCQDTKSCRTYTDYGKGPRGNSGSGKPHFLRWLNSSKQNLKPIKMTLWQVLCCHQVIDAQMQPFSGQGIQGFLVMQNYKYIVMMMAATYIIKCILSLHLNEGDKGS